MAKYSQIQTDFSGGLISDHILGRADLERVQKSARTLTNFLPTLQGPIDYRKGFKFITDDTDVGTEDNYGVASVDLTLNTQQVYRVVFTDRKLKVYTADGTLKATVVTEYSKGDLENLRFSSETDGLYVVHPLFAPKKLTPQSDIEAQFIKSSDSHFLYSDEDGSGAGLGANNTGDLKLRGNVEVTGDTTWVLEDITFEVEPFLEPDNSGNEFTIAHNKSYVKLDAGSSNYFAVIKADFDDDTGDNSAGSFGRDWYVQYTIGDNTFLGLVVKQSTDTDYTLADPTDYIVYVDPVDTILDVEDQSAMFYLLDNEETGSSSSADNIKLVNEGVPDNEIHLRCDTLVFNKGYEGAYIKLDADRLSNNIAQGGNRTLTRWVRLKEHLGTEDHPVEFITGTNALRASNLTAGSVYKILHASANTYYSIGVDANGEYKVSTAVMVLPNGNKTFTFNSAIDGTRAHNTAAWDGTDDVTIGSDGCVANLSTAQQFDVMKCYSVASDSLAKIEEYSGGNTDGTLIVPADNSNLTITEVANDVTLTAVTSVFDATRDVGRFFKGELPSGNVYMKCIKHSSGQQIVCQILNTIPRNSRTLEFENGGKFKSFSFGAWYDGNYPQSVTKYEQRRVYAGTFDNPNYIFFSRADNELNFQPTQDDKTVLDTDGITYELSNRTASIQWLTSLKDLVIGTTGGIYRVVPNQYLYGVSPKTIRIELSQEEPCKAQAVSVGNSIFYPDQSGTRLLEYKFELNIQNSSSNDVSKLIYPTFNSDAIKKIVYQHTPQPRVWCLTENNNLYVLTHHRQEEFYAWSKVEYATGIAINKEKFLDISVLSKGTTTDTDTVVVTTSQIIQKPSGNTGELVSHLQLNEEESGVVTGVTTTYPSYLDRYVEVVKSSTDTFDYTATRTAFGANAKVSYVADGYLVRSDAYLDSSGDPTPLPHSEYLSTFGTLPSVVHIGQPYSSEVKMMFPTWSGTNKPAYGAETTRIISIKPFLIDSVMYNVGVDDDQKETTLINADVSSNYGKGNGFTGFDKERPIAGSTYGVDKVPTFKHSKPYPLTIASVVTKSDLN